jgi:hypothetical protein
MQAFARQLVTTLLTGNNQFFHNNPSNRGVGAEAVNNLSMAV